MKKIFFQIIRAFYPPIIVFVIHTTLMMSINIYTIWPDFDIPMHFLGGFVMAITALRLLRLAEKEKWMQINKKIVSLLISVCFVALVVILWECAEWLSDHLLGSFMQEGLDDTMLDMVLGLCGAFVSGTLGIFKKN